MSAGGVDHKVDVRMVALVVEGGVPFQILFGYLEVGGEGIGLCPKHLPPSFALIESESLRILTAQRDDHRPHVSFVVIQFLRDLAELDGDSVIGEQTVGAEAFSSRSGGDIVSVGLGLHHLVSVIFQSAGDKLRSVSYRWLFQIVLILQHLFTVGKVFEDFFDELLLP